MPVCHPCGNGFWDSNKVFRGCVELVPIQRDYHMACRDIAVDAFINKADFPLPVFIETARRFSDFYVPIADGRGFDMLDLGANTENTAHHLVDFAILGSYYAENVRGINKPRVALISNGAEESKGSPTVKEAHEILSAMSEINFIGNIESRDLLSGGADVVVTDGFTGNAILKAIEGTATVLMKEIKSAIMAGSVTTKIGGALIKKPLSVLKDLMSTDGAGGAAFVGLKAPVVKAHGNSSELAIASALKQIHKIILLFNLEKY